MQAEAVQRAVGRLAEEEQRVARLGLDGHAVLGARGEPRVARVLRAQQGLLTMGLGFEKMGAALSWVLERSGV